MAVSRAQLPLVPRMSSWLAACLAGRVTPCEFATAARGEDVRHLLVDDTGAAYELADLPALAPASPTRRAHCALPVPGDPLGVAGPPEFNREAIDAGGAVLVSGDPAGPCLGLVPAHDARTVLWRLAPARAPMPLDPDEHDRALRQEISLAATRLADLEVARWRPEVADLLMTGAPELRLPPGIPAGLAPRVGRALWCLDIVALALDDEGGARTAPEMAARRRVLDGVDRAARRVLVSTCGTLG